MKEVSRTLQELQNMFTFMFGATRETVPFFYCARSPFLCLRLRADSSPAERPTARAVRPPIFAAEVHPPVVVPVVSEGASASGSVPVGLLLSTVSL